MEPIQARTRIRKVSTIHRHEKIQNFIAKLKLEDTNMSKKKIVNVSFVKWVQLKVNTFFLLVRC